MSTWETNGWTPPAVLLALPALVLLLSGPLVERGAAAEGGQAAASQEAQPEPGSELTVYHVTMGPGDAVWERFGHNAIWIHDPARGVDAAYNWGLFDFGQEDFIPRFIRGQMLYWMGAFDAHRMMEMYAEENRTVEIQELRLTPAQRVELRDFVEWNALPENRHYHYDYFRDNCSTRVRDALDLALGGALREPFEQLPSGRTWRSMVREVTEVSLPEYLALDILMGPRTDREISAWQEMFIPMDLRDRLREVTLAGTDGDPLPLVISEEILFQADRPDVEGRRRAFLPLLFLLSLLLSGGIVLMARAAAAGHRPAGWGVGLLGGGWGLLSGVMGTLMLVMWLWTDHVFAHRNLNLLHLSPLGLGLAVLVPLHVLRGKAAGLTLRLADAAVALSVLGLLLGALPWVHQSNALTIALALPLHLAVWWALRSLGGIPDQLAPGQVPSARDASAREASRASIG